MTPKERFFAQLEGKAVDRIPNFSILMNFAAKYVNKTMGEFCSDYRVLTEGILKACEDFGIDILSTMSDPFRETADYGATHKFLPDTIPSCEKFITCPEDLHKLKPFKVEDSVRMLDRVRAIEHFKSVAGETYPVLGWVEGSAAESADLMGLTEYIYALYDEPEFVNDMMDICLETAINCVDAQIKAGADIIGVGDAVAGVIGTGFYRDLILPYEQKLFAEIKKRGAVARLHICGNITPLLEDIKTCGADIIDIDHMVDFRVAKEVLDGHAIVCGNFDPVWAVMSATPDSIAESVNRCIDEADSKCIIMAGCEIPRDTPYENLLAIHKALVARGSMPGWAN